MEYILQKKKKNCQKVADAFTEIYEYCDIVVVDIGKYGFVILQYIRIQYGFEQTTILQTENIYFMTYGKNGSIYNSWIYQEVLHCKIWIQKIYSNAYQNANNMNF